MTLPAVGSAAYPTPTELRDQILRDLYWYGLRNGIAFNVLPGSEHYLLATSLANRVSIAIANNGISNDQRNPLTAEDTYLRDFARVYGIFERPAAKAVGFIRISATGAVNIPSTFQASGANGKKYLPVASAVVANGDSFEMVAVDAGTASNLAAGAVLTWDSSALANLLPQSTVLAGGIAGGAPVDDTETIRRRLIDRLAAQAIGGNEASVKGWAEGASSAIQAAYVYAAAQGPGAYSVAITSATGDRSLPVAVVAQAGAAVLAQMPGGVVKINATTVYPQEVDVLLKASLPLPATAGGAGGGWLDASPWPAEDTTITVVTSTALTVDSTASPAVGNRIGIWDPEALDSAGASAPVMREFAILTVGGSANAWEITVDGSITFAAVDMRVSAGAVNLAAYAQTFLGAMRELGPGEKSDNPNIVPRANRYPRPDVVEPYAITSRQTSEVTNENPEISDLQYSAVYETGTATPITSPDIPPTTADPPRILVLNHFAIRKA
jgi:uncharacterized phage protein gp47/JayE